MFDTITEDSLKWLFSSWHKDGATTVSGQDDMNIGD